MHRWDPAGLPIYRAGPLNDPNYVSDLFNGGGSPPISSCNMDTYKEVLYAAGLPALISTGITLLYLLLKAYQFAVYALPHQTERRLAAATPGGRQQVHSSIAGEKGYQEVHEQAPGNISDEYGAELQQPSGTVPLSRGWENVCIAARHNAEEHSVEPFVRENAKRLQGQGNRYTKDNDGQRPRGPHDDSTGVLEEGGRWSNAENEQSRNDGRSSSQERSNPTTHDGISGCRLAMCCIPDPGTISHTEGAPAANKRCAPEHTVKYNAGTQYNRLIDRQGTSLDLEAAFKQIKIS